MTTYVYEGTEVRLTGRTATRTVKAANRDRIIVLSEITPVDTTFDWKKWVPMDALFVVKEQ